MKCMCGCRQEVRRGNRFINHHYFKSDECKCELVERLHARKGEQRPWLSERNMVNNPLSNEVSREKMRKSVKLAWSNTELRIEKSMKTLLYYASHPEVIDNIRCQVTRNWQDPNYVQKQMQSRGVKPNKIEIKLEKKLISYGFKFVGDGQLIIGGKCPDYHDGSHKLIELFGDYWHKGQNPQDRIDFFKQYGYDCLVIWENELKNEQLLFRKVQLFSEEA